MEWKDDVNRSIPDSNLIKEIPTKRNLSFSSSLIFLLSINLLEKKVRIITRKGGQVALAFNQKLPNT